MCGHITVVHNTAQNGSDNLPSYPLENHCSDDTYRRGRGTSMYAHKQKWEMGLTDWPQTRLPHRTECRWATFACSI